MDMLGDVLEVCRSWYSLLGEEVCRVRGKVADGGCVELIISLEIVQISNLKHLPEVSLLVCWRRGMVSMLLMWCSRSVILMK